MPDKDVLARGDYLGGDAACRAPKESGKFTLMLMVAKRCIGDARSPHERSMNRTGFQKLWVVGASRFYLMPQIVPAMTRPSMNSSSGLLL